MGWTPDFIDKARGGGSICDLARRYGEVVQKGAGKGVTRCIYPDHLDQKPSMTLNCVENLFYCFPCQRGGDIFDFVMEAESLDFPDAVEFLAEFSGITWGPDDRTDTGWDRDHRKNDLLFAVAQAAEIYHKRLLDMENRNAQQARKFLKGRNLGSVQAKTFMIGHSYLRERGPSDNLIREIKPQMFSYFKKELDRADSEFDQWFEETLVDAGLAKEYQGQLTDFFFDERIMFTIFDASGKPIAFSGRQLPGGRDPKYRNSPNSKIYAKDETLYGLNWAKKNLTNKNSTIVSEGCLDVIALHECGLPTAVAPCGTSMTEKQVKKLAKYTKNFSLCFDSDSAGQKATERFTQWEEEDDLNLTVVELPAGQDPGDFHANGMCDALTNLTESTTRFLRWRIERIWGLADPNDIEGRSMTAETMLQIVKDHHNGMIHDDYIRQIAEITELSYSHLVEKFKGIEKTPKRKAPMPAPQEPPDDDYRRVFDQPPPDLHERPRRVIEEPKGRQSDENLDSAECRALSLILHNQQALENLNLWPDRISEQFFFEGVHREIFNSLIGSTTFEEAKGRLEHDERASSLLQKLHQEGPLQNLDDGKVTATIAEVLYWTAKHWHDEIASEATKNSDLKAAQELAGIHQLLSDLIDSLDPFSKAAEQLLEWLQSLGKGES